MSTAKASVMQLFMTVSAIALSLWIAGLAVFIHRMNYNVTLEQVTAWMLSTKCQDYNANCEIWARNAECTANPAYMSAYCAQSCGKCTLGIRNESSTLLDNAERRLSDDIMVDKHVKAEAKATDEEDDVEMDDESVDEEDEDDDNTTEAENDEPEPESADEEIASGKICDDAATEEDCIAFAKQGECDKNPDWMHVNCKRSCGLCPACSDGHELCQFWAKSGECKVNPGYMLVHCAKSCKTCMAVNDEDQDEIFVEDSLGRKIVCKDKHDSRVCEARRAEGECERNPGWMIVFCGKTCGKCDLLPQSARCVPEVWNDTEYRYEDALKKGDVNKVFTRILEELPTAEIVLQPPAGPWVIKMPNFVSELERERLLAHTLPNVKRSTDQGAFDDEGVQEQVVSSGRTSSNAWCMNECAADPVVVNLTERISRLTRVPVKNFESYQILQYKIGQKYDVHHDSSDEDKQNLSGPRILTFFIYLSDVEEGGETFFDKLNIKVKPQKGMAILWPSVLDDNPRKIDYRTTHAALPVIKGEKLAANIWMHQNDFMTANLWGCTGAFDE